MADDNVDQRLDRIEATLLTLSSKTDLAALREEVHNELVREFDRVATSINDLRSEQRQLATSFIGLPAILQLLADRLRDVTDRVRRLEDGGRTHG
jgi:hypothetical protein